MEYQKRINFLDNTPSQTSIFCRKSWVEIMFNHGENVKIIIKLDLKLQC